MKIYIDPEEIAAKLGKMKERIQEDVRKGVERLATMTNAYIVEEFSSSLHSSLNTYKKSYSFKQESTNIWVISVSKEGLWIENGIESNYDMKQGLLKNAETSASGKKYKVIPFDHASPEQQPQNLNQFSKDIRNEVKQALKDNKIDFAKIETNQDGSPRVGKLHSLDFGGEVPGKGNTPIMQGISIYQSAKGGKVRRDILTFRTVTDAPDGKWVHPGYKGRKFLEKGEKWALETWEKEILPAIMEKWK